MLVHYLIYHALIKLCGIDLADEEVSGKLWAEIHNFHIQIYCWKSIQPHRHSVAALKNTIWEFAFTQIMI